MHAYCEGYCSSCCRPGAPLAFRYLGVRSECKSDDHRGVVKDASGAVLPGVTVEAASPGA